ncbi:uncharacterized protein LOC134533837 [Bacillus rossius redtenbacheri]|uniref:uncharacterized protein LOC134533837 n=1 Tax=Bacillus rossius redtenbacheri TaxID=93214 RepID=UPI002FDD3726
MGVLLVLVPLAAAVCLVAGDGYVDISGVGRYNLVERNVTWRKARSLCNDEAAHLLVLDSAKEYEAIIQHFGRNITSSGQEVHIGFHSLFVHDEWLTIFDDPLGESGYSKWIIDNPEEGERCGGLCTEPDGLCSQHCDKSLFFICEQESK